jgi:hypothetical protein
MREGDEDAENEVEVEKSEEPNAKDEELRIEAETFEEGDPLPQSIRKRGTRTRKR